MPHLGIKYLAWYKTYGNFPIDNADYNDIPDLQELKDYLEASEEMDKAENVEKKIVELKKNGRNGSKRTDYSVEKFSQTSVESLRPYNFTVQKNYLREYSNKLTSGFSFDSVPESGGLFGLGDHKVTGSELNGIILKVQDYFYNLRSFNNDTITEFRHVFDLVEALDKEYIPAIMVAVNASEEASFQALTSSDQAKAASEEAKEAVRKANKSIVDNKKLLDSLRNIVDGLNKQKEEFNKIKHLKDVDTIWRDIRRLESELIGQKQRLSKQEDDIDQKITDLFSFRTSIEQLKHLNDIDAIWEDVESYGEKIDDFPSMLEALSAQLSGKIDEMLTFKEKLDRIEHIIDVDVIWVDTNHLKEKISKISTSLEKKSTDLEKEISALRTKIDKQVHFEDLDTIWTDLQTVKKSVKYQAELIKHIDEKQQRINSEFSDAKDFIADISKQEHLRDIDTEWDYSKKIAKQMKTADDKIKIVENQLVEYETRLQTSESYNILLKSKIRTAYIIAGGAVVLSVIQLILQILGVL